MQIRADFTKEELMQDSDPLALACHPLGKIKMLADFFWATPHGEVEAGNVLNQSNLNAIYETLNDAREEIEFIVDASNEQWREDNIRTRTLERTLKDCISYLEDPDDKPDPKTMAAKIKKQMGS